MINNYQNRRFLVLMPVQARHGVGKKSFTKKRRPQSAKARLGKKYSVSRLHQNFGSMFVSKIPFKEYYNQPSKPNRHVNVGNTDYTSINQRNAIKRSNSKTLLEESMWSPEVATVEQTTRNNEMKFGKIPFNRKPKKLKSKPLSMLHYTGKRDLDEHYTKMRKKSEKGPNNLCYRTNSKHITQSLKKLDEIRNGYSVSAFPIRRAKKVLIYKKKRRSHSRGNGNNKDQTDPFNRALRVGNFHQSHPVTSSAHIKTVRSIKRTNFFSPPQQLVHPMRNSTSKRNSSHKIIGIPKDTTNILRLNIRMPNENHDDDNDVNMHTLFTSKYADGNDDDNDVNMHTLFTRKYADGNNNFGDLNGWEDNNPGWQESSQVIATEMDNNFEALCQQETNTSLGSDIRRKKHKRPKSARIRRINKNNAQKSGSFKPGSRPKSASIRRGRKI